MRFDIGRSSIAIFLMCLLPMGVGGCVEQLGQSGRDSEWRRLRTTGPFHVVRADHNRAVVSARGRQVAIEPADGFCVAEDSIETSTRSIFALIGDCVIEGTASGTKNAKGGLDLPNVVPGIMTVSISGDRGFEREGTGAGSMDGLRSFLESPEGRSMLGRGGTANTVSIREIVENDDALFVYVEDNDAGILPILSSRFWRAFIELNGRLTVVTISGFRDRPLDRTDLLAFLVKQVEKLEVANAVPVNEPSVMIAGAGGTQRLSDLQPELVVTTAKPPVPASRPEQSPDEAPLITLAEDQPASASSSDDPVRALAEESDAPPEAPATQIAAVTLDEAPVAPQEDTAQSALSEPQVEPAASRKPASPAKKAPKKAPPRVSAAPKKPVAAPSKRPSELATGSAPKKAPAAPVRPSGS